MTSWLMRVESIIHNDEACDREASECSCIVCALTHVARQRGHAGAVNFVVRVFGQELLFRGTGAIR